MGTEGHAPTAGTGARALYLLGQGVCPECEGELQTKNTGVTCADCGTHYQIGREQ